MTPPDDLLTRALPPDRSLVRADLIDDARSRKSTWHAWDETATELADELERASAEIRTILTALESYRAHILKQRPLRPPLARQHPRAERRQAAERTKRKRRATPKGSAPMCSLGEDVRQTVGAINLAQTIGSSPRASRAITSMSTAPKPGIVMVGPCASAGPRPGKRA